MSTNINYLDLIAAYLDRHPTRQRDYFKFLHDNHRREVNELAYRFLRAEYLQAKCLSFRVIP